MPTKIVEIRTYNIELYNKNPDLNLKTNEQEIFSALKQIQDLKTGGFGKIINIEIGKYIIKATVRETNNRWHTNFGNLLANNQNMRYYCKPGESNKMFKWTRIK
jgi:hypothetical protein